MQHTSFTLTFPSTHFKAQGNPSFLNIAFIPKYYFSTVDWAPNINKMFNFYWWSFSALLAWSAPSHDAQQCWSVCCKFINQLCIISLGQKLIIEFQQEPLSPPRTIQYWAAFISFFKSAHSLLWRKMSLGNCWPLMQKWMGRECNLFNSQYLNV